MPFLGDRFRAAREARGLSLAEVSEHIHIRAIYLDCIEREDWPAIGAPVYTRGFVRAYARFIGLAPEEAVAEYAVASGNPSVTPVVTVPVAPPRPITGVRETPKRPVPPTTPSTPRAPLERPSARRAPSPRSERRTSSDRGRSGGSGGPSLGVIVLGLIAFVLVGAVGYTLFDTNWKANRPPPAVPSAAPHVAAAATPPPARRTAPPAVVPRTIAFTVNQRSWVEIALDGQAPLSATLEAGTTKTFHAKTAKLRVGNAGGVSVSVDGKPIGTLGAAGAVVERTFEL